jgi:hypothetical protein
MFDKSKQFKILKRKIQIWMTDEEYIQYWESLWTPRHNRNERNLKKDLRYN